jgi:hypothetical protein
LLVNPPDEGAVTLLRVAAIAGGDVVGNTAHSYIFEDALLAQPERPEGLPTTWGSSNTIDADYAIDQNIVGSSIEAARSALHSLPIVMLTTSKEALWDPSTGIYMNPSSEGREWERPASLEVVDSAGSAQIDCGIRIQGGSSTENWKAAKLSMRVAFRSEFGSGRFVYPLFEESSVKSFNTLVLDAHLNLTFIHPNHSQRVRAQYIRDQFTSDLQNAAGSLAPHGKFVHLLINGLYWGVYDLHERPDDSFAADYLGGEAAEWDVLKHDAQTVVAGDASRFTELMTRAGEDLSNQERYQEVAELLDIDEFITYMLVNIYTGNSDWPHHNWYVARRRNPEGRFRFFSWDAEFSVTNTDIDLSNIGEGEPGNLWTSLQQNAGFRQLVQGRSAELFGEGGPLYVNAAAPNVDPSEPENNVPGGLYLKRAEEVRESMLLEAARWGDNQRDEPYTADDWQRELDWALDEFFPARSQKVLGQLQ